MIAWATLLLVLAALLSAGLAIWRLLRGPTHADRIVALDIFLAAALALCIAAALATGRTVFIDVGVGLALVGFVATLGWARLLERAPAQRPASKAPRGSA
jgi:multicomponent Na+:H+ antiporter subunit F